jgi:hypothetical protein
MEASFRRMPGFYEKCGDGTAILMSMKIRPTQARKPQRKNLHSLNYLILVRAETSVMNLFFAAAFSNAIGLLKRL